MKRLISFVIAALLLFSCGASLAAGIDLDSMSEEELMDLRTRIDGKITIRDKGDLIYDKDGVQIKWMGFDASSSHIKLILVVTNPYDHSVFFEIEEGAFNGIQVSCANSFSYEIGPGLSFITSSNNCWLFGTEDLALVGITVDDITDVYVKFSMKKEKYDRDNLAGDEIRFAVK